MADQYPEGPDFYITDALKTAGGLNAQIWEHARRAAAKGLAPVVEIWARSSELSRALNLWWHSGDTLMRETLSGVYLIRVNLARFGPESVVRLTPYALSGVPLFLGWNPIGQVLSAREFDKREPEDLALPLSAFVEDVLAGRPHSLNPRPKLGNVKWDMAVAELRRAKTAFRLPPSSLSVAAAPAPLPTLDVAPLARLEGAVPLASDPELKQTLPMLTSHAEAGSATSDASELEPSASAASPGTDAAEALSSAPSAGPLAQLAAELELILGRARTRLESFAAETGLDLDYSLESLRALDGYVDAEVARDVHCFEKRGDQLALLGVYLGDTVCHHAEGEWYVDTRVERLSDALKLRLSARGIHVEREIAPIQLIAELCADRSRSFFGHAVALCSGH